MSYAFISHAVKADGAFAMRLAGDLRARSLRVWKAPESIKPGERWAEAIEAAVETCDTMLTILTPEAVQSRWVSTEMSMAIEREHEGKMTVVPLDLRACKVPRMWAQYQQISFSGSYEAGLKALLEKLGIASSLTDPLVDPLPSGSGWDYHWKLPQEKVQSKGEKSLPTLNIKNPWAKYLEPKKEPYTFGTGILSGYSEESSGDKARGDLDYRKAVAHYTKAIAHFEESKFLHKPALGAIYYKRGQCWMSLDLWNSLGKVEKTTPSSLLLQKPWAASPFNKSPFGAFTSLLQVQEEYTNAQADFAKAKELGYQPNESG
jgi:TIR domain